MYVGDESSCFYGSKEGWVVIHACKSPCHQRAVGYKGSLSPSHPNYLIKEEPNHLFLNLVDMEKPLKHEFAKPIITKAMQFIKENISKNNILVHCNVGISRSPTLIMIFLAKIKKEISNNSYDDAKNAFLKIYPAYNPSIGIEIYLRKHWDDLLK